MTKGRKRKPRNRAPGKREPNGRLSRNAEAVAARNLDALDLEQRAMIAPALEARERVLGVAAKHSRDQLAGSFVGRLCLTKQISRTQYDAAMTWLEDSQNYAFAVAAPKGEGAINLNATRGAVAGAENVAWSRRCVSRYEGALNVVRALQNEMRANANLFGALQIAVNRDIELHHLIGDVRVVLNALARHYRLAVEREAA